MEGINENKRQVGTRIRKDFVEKADKIVSDGLIVGISTRSGLIEYALAKVFKEVFKEA
jgi:hypothetical protein